MISELAARDVTAVAVDLDGHGLKSRSRHVQTPSLVADVTASSAAATLIEQIAKTGGGEPCVVVAHSMGGAVATAAAEQAPHLFARLVYVTAFAPVAGIPPVAYIGSAEDAGSMVPGLLRADPAVVGALRVDPVADHERLRETFYADVDVEVADAAISMLSPDGPAGIPGERLDVTAERFGRVPRTYVVCTKDNAVKEPLQRRFIRELDAVANTPTRVVELDSAHSPMLSQPAVLADAIYPR